MIPGQKYRKYKEYLKNCLDDEDFELSSVMPFEEWKELEEIEE